MPMLIKKYTNIQTHWRTTAQRLSSILPRSGGDYKPGFQQGGLVVNLYCSHYPTEIASRFAGATVPVVPFLETVPDESPTYWLGWYEEWCVPREGRSARRAQFKMSGITIYRGAEGAAKRQVLRAEWTGAENYDQLEDRHVFPADGAAHPHWHLDGLRAYSEELKGYFETLEKEYELRRDLAVEVARGADAVEAEDLFGILTPPPSAIPSADESAWAAIHLPARARWSEIAWQGPAGPHDTHATTPADFEEIRRWLTSCVRYLQAQLQSELLRGRW